MDEIRWKCIGWQLRDAAGRFNPVAHTTPELGFGYPELVAADVAPEACT
jgi:hypothetical protein